MKIRNGFVSNSSSSSFIVCTKKSSSAISEEVRKTHFNDVIQFFNERIEDLKEVKRTNLVKEEENKLKYYTEKFNDGYLIIHQSIDNYYSDEIFKIFNLLGLEYEEYE